MNAYSPRVICPICEQEMAFASAVKGIFPSPASRLFRCEPCAVTETRHAMSVLRDQSEETVSPAL
jgi:hypothetical protein